jgi:hypothetical protein
MSDLFTSILDELSSFPSLTVDVDLPSTTGGLADLGSQTVGLSGSGVFSKSNFSDHPAVSAEYVKFLASNTGMDSMSKFTDALKKMGDEVKESAVKSSNATKQVLLVSNKVDDVKAKLLTLERRLTRLESK